MADLVNLLVWSLVVFSATNIVVVSKIFSKFRVWVTYKDLKLITDEKGTRYEGALRKFQTISALVHCPMCLGFWMGVFFSIFLYSPSLYVLLGDTTLVNILSDGLLGSIVSWLLYLVINEKQSNA